MARNALKQWEIKLNPMEKVTVATFNAELPAKAVLNRLNQSGIEAHIIDEKNMQRFWFFTKPYARIHVKVAKDDLDRAGDILNRLDKEENLLKDAIRCPQCGSSRVEYPQMTRYFVLPTLFVQLGHILRIIPMQFYCRSCHHTWRLQRVTADKGSLKKKPTPA